MVRALLAGTKTQTRRVVKVLSQNGGGSPTEHYVASARVGWFDIGDEGRICYGALFNGANGGDLFVDSPYGQPGDRLWVRESWQGLFDGGYDGERRFWTTLRHSTAGERADRIVYRADDGERLDREAEEHGTFLWRKSIHMPRWASRLTLEITNVRVERLQDISEADASEEGVETDVWDQALVARKYDEPDAWFQMWSEDMDHYVDLECIHRASYRTLWDSLNAKRGFGWDVNPWVWVLEFRVLPQEISNV